MKLTIEERKKRKFKMCIHCIHNANHEQLVNTQQVVEIQAFHEYEGHATGYVCCNNFLRCKSPQYNKNAC